MRSVEMMQWMVRDMRARDDPKASVLRPRIGQIDHHEQLLRAQLVAARIVPAPPVLVPEQGRSAAWFRDQESAGPSRIGRSAIAKEKLDRWRAHDVRIFGIVAEMNERAVRAHCIARFLAFAK